MHTTMPVEAAKIAAECFQAIKAALHAENGKAKAAKAVKEAKAACAAMMPEEEAQALAEAQAAAKAFREAVKAAGGTLATQAAELLGNAMACGFVPAVTHRGDVSQGWKEAAGYLLKGKAGGSHFLTNWGPDWTALVNDTRYSKRMAEAFSRAKGQQLLDPVADFNAALAAMEGNPAFLPMVERLATLALETGARWTAIAAQAKDEAETETETETETEAA